MTTSYALICIPYLCNFARLFIAALVLYSAYKNNKLQGQPLFSLLILLCSLGAGIIIAHTTNIASALFLLSSLICGKIYHPKAGVKFFQFILLWMCAGALLLFLQKQERELLARHLFYQKINLKGEVIECSENTTTRKFFLLLRAHEVTTSQGAKNPSFFYLALYTSQCSFFVGDIVSLQNITLKPPSETSSITPCSFSDYLTRNNCLASYFVTPKNNLALESRPVTSLSRWLDAKRKKVLTAIQQKALPIVSDYALLIFFGSKNGGTPEPIKTPFSHWGVTHYLARSGLHIALLIIIWTKLLSIIPLHIFYKRLILLIMSGAYHLLSFPSVSFARSLLLFILTLIGKLSQQPTHATHLLLFICTTIVALNPIYLFFLDFQLTFILTFCLIATTSRSLFLKP